MVERNLAKVEVAGPSPVFRSKKADISSAFFVFLFLFFVGEGGKQVQKNGKAGEGCVINPKF